MKKITRLLRPAGYVGLGGLLYGVHIGAGLAMTWTGAVLVTIGTLLGFIGWTRDGAERVNMDHVRVRRNDNSPFYGEWIVETKNRAGEWGNPMYLRTRDQADDYANLLATQIAYFQKWPLKG